MSLRLTEFLFWYKMVSGGHKTTDSLQKCPDTLLFNHVSNCQFVHQEEARVCIQRNLVIVSVTVDVD